MLKCHQLVENADALLADQLPWQRRLSLRVHLLLCHHCRRYLRQLRRLLIALPTMHGRADDREIARVMARVNGDGH